jgi:hypothetical protein
MANLTRWSLVLAAAAMMGGACGGTKLGGGTGGITGTGGECSGYYGGCETGGSFATGGSFGTGGFATGGSFGTGGFATGGFGGDAGGTTGWGGEFGTGGFGGTFGTGGYIGYGGSYGTGGDYGTGGSPFPDGGTCSAPTTGPLSTSDSPRPFGWTYSGPTTGAGGAAAPGDAGTGPAICQTVLAAYPGTNCEGTATLQALAIGTVVAFADGAKLTWDGTLPSALMPYVVPTMGGSPDTVWVHYQEKHTVVCPFCGAYTTRTLEIRNGDGTGKVRFFDQQGDVLPNLTAPQILDIFGTTATQTFSCTFPTYAGCNSYLRTEFDEQLGTTPPQTLLDATLTKVTTPNGIFQVIWASSAEGYVQPEPYCNSTDNPGVASDTGFVAALLGPQ